MPTRPSSRTRRRLPTRSRRSSPPGSRCTISLSPISIEQLTPEQVEQVKDGMTYNTVHFTYDNYCKFVPQLTDVQKAKILEFLKAGREEAMDGGSQEEKATIFKKYKGRIANYLHGEGIDMKQQTKDYMDEQKGGKTPATQPRHEFCGTGVSPVPRRARANAHATNDYRVQRFWFRVFRFRRFSMAIGSRCRSS